MERTRQRFGFTLIEVLMVALIIGFMVAVSVPYMVKSIRGNRLRTAARSVIQMARYARTKAILSQGRYILEIHSGSGRLVASPAGGGEGKEERSIEGVRIDYIDVGGQAGSDGAGPHTIRFERNGLSTPFEVRLIDESQASITIVSDAVGSMHSDREAGL